MTEAEERRALADGAEVVSRALAVEPEQVDSLTSAHLNGKFVESLGLLGYLRHFGSAHGTKLVDDSGKEYLDFVAGYGSVPLGHNHPTVRGAVQAAMDAQLPHFILAAPEALPARLAQRLAERAPGDLDMCFLSSSGSEAVDGALKLARAVTSRDLFVYADRAYHGATFGALSVTDDPRRAQFGALGSHRCVEWGQLLELEEALRRRDVAAVILEPMQGEGGVRPAPEGYLAKAKELCRRYGSLLIVDEVQTGFARTGSYFACEHEGVVPDVLVLGKAMSGGLVPASAYVTTRKHWQTAYGDLARCELHCTTYRGGPLACAAALATIEVIEREGLVDHVTQEGKRFGDKLREVCRSSTLIREVRGRGFLWGIELASRSPGTLAALSAQWVVVGLLERGIVTQVCTLAPNVVRIEPPLIASASELDHFASTLEDVLSEHARGRLQSMAAVGARLIKGKLAKNPAHKGVSS